MESFQAVLITCATALSLTVLKNAIGILQGMIKAERTPNARTAIVHVLGVDTSARELERKPPQPFVQTAPLEDGVGGELAVSVLRVPSMNGDVHEGALEEAKRDLK